MNAYYISYLLQTVNILTRVGALERASVRYQSTRYAWRPTEPACPTRLWSDRRWTDAARSSGTYSPPSQTSPPGHTPGDVLLKCQQAAGGAAHVRLDSHLDDVGKVFPLDMVVSLDEDLPQDGLTDGVVLGVELIKAVECVPVLKGMRTVKPQPCAAQAPPRPPTGARHCCSPTACMSRVSTLRSKAVRFMLSNTSLRVWPRPCSMWTISPGYFFIARLMNRSRCFWFMQEDACMCVSTWSESDCHLDDLV